MRSPTSDTTSRTSSMRPVPSLRCSSAAEPAWPRASPHRAPLLIGSTAPNSWGHLMPTSVKEVLDHAAELALIDSFIDDHLSG